MTHDVDDTCPVVAAAVAAELERRDRATQARRDAEMAELAQLRADREALRPLVEACLLADAAESAILADNAEESRRTARTRTISAEPWLAAVDACREARLALADAVLERMGER